MYRAEFQLARASSTVQYRLDEAKRDGELNYTLLVKFMRCVSTFPKFKLISGTLWTSGTCLVHKKKFTKLTYYLVSFKSVILLFLTFEIKNCQGFFTLFLLVGSNLAYNDKCRLHKFWNVFFLPSFNVRLKIIYDMFFAYIFS